VSNYLLFRDLRTGIEMPLTNPPLFRQISCQIDGLVRTTLAGVWAAASHGWQPQESRDQWRHSFENAQCRNAPTIKASSTATSSPSLQTVVGEIARFVAALRSSQNLLPAS